MWFGKHLRHNILEDMARDIASMVLPRDLTLGGYMAKHDRAAAFGGADGHAYSCAPYLSDQPDDEGRFGAALLFVRWDATGAHPVGHVETEYLTYGATPEEARERLGALSLFDVKAALDHAIETRPEGW